jgi:hypothetical protein
MAVNDLNNQGGSSLHPNDDVYEAIHMCQIHDSLSLEVMECIFISSSNCYNRHDTIMGCVLRSTNSSYNYVC